MKTKYKLSVFTDFDGTIIDRDLGDEVFKEFGEFEPHITNLKTGKIGIIEYWNTVCATLKPGITEQEIREFAALANIDPYFKPFVEFCKGLDIPVAVISDGFDVYIKEVLKNAYVKDIPFYSNKMIFKAGKVSPFFPGATESCTCMCASCKRNSLLTHAEPENVIVFIGDGYSDFCAAEHADIVFAKKYLAAYCNKNKIPHYTYTSFFDIKRILDKIIKENSFKPRRQAVLKRKEAFETE